MKFNNFDYLFEILLSNEHGPKL